MLVVFVLFLACYQEVKAVRQLTRYGELCTNRCRYHGEDYMWCNTRATDQGWDYCSWDGMLTRYGQACKKMCSNRGENYYWCNKKSGGWDYCSPPDTDVVLLTGGDDTETSVEVFDPLGQCQVQLPQLELGRRRHTSTYLESAILLCGSASGSGGSSCIHHWLDRTFQHRYQLRGDRWGHAQVNLGGTVYLVGGGSTEADTRSMETWSGNSWTSGPSMQQGRKYACGVATSDTTFIITGGYLDGHSAVVLSSVEEFNTVTRRWRFLARMPGGGRNGHSCVNIGGYRQQVLVAGGTGGNGIKLDSALLYRVDTGKWRAAASLNIRRTLGQMVVNGRILYIGGYKNNRLDTIEEYDAEDDSWTLLESRLETPRVGFGASVVPRSVVGC